MVLKEKKRCLWNIWRIDFQISKIALHSVFSGKILIKLISTALNCARGCWRISRNNGISPIPPVFNGPELLSSDSGVLPLCPTRTTLKLHNILVNFKLVNSYDGDRYHTETSPLICGANQWTGFYMITASVMKESKRS